MFSKDLYFSCPYGVGSSQRTTIFEKALNHELEKENPKGNCRIRNMFPFTDRFLLKLLSILDQPFVCCFEFKKACYSGFCWRSRETVQFLKWLNFVFGTCWYQKVV